MAGRKGKKVEQTMQTRLRTGDTVMVLAGGNSVKGKELAGKTGKILRFMPKRNRVVVEGLNLIKRRKKAMHSREVSGVIEKEGSIHISNIMFYSQEHSRPVRLKVRVREDGRKVRGYLNPVTKEFEQIDA